MNKPHADFSEPLDESEIADREAAADKWDGEGVCPYCDGQGRINKVCADCDGEGVVFDIANCGGGMAGEWGGIEPVEREVECEKCVGCGNWDVECPYCYPQRS